MVKIIKKFSNMFIILFLVTIIFILMAEKFNWSMDFNIVPFFLIVFVVTLLCMMTVSILGILESIRKEGKRSVGKEFSKKFLGSFLIIYVVALLKNDVDILIVFASSSVISILSYYHVAK